MKSYKHYTTAEKERKVFAAVMLALLVIIVIWGVLEACGIMQKVDWPATVEYPMANANVSWEQTFHPGAWSG